MLKKEIIDLILKKDFQVSLNGYDPHQVDAFLDEIIEKIILLNDKINQSEMLLNNQKLLISELKREIFEKDLLINNLKNQEFLKTKKPKE